MINNKSSQKKNKYQKKMKPSPLPVEIFIAPQSITENHIPKTDFSFPPDITCI